MASMLDFGAAGIREALLQSPLASSSGSSLSSGSSRAVAVGGRCRNGCASFLELNSWIVVSFFDNLDGDYVMVMDVEYSGIVQCYVIVRYLSFLIEI